MCLKDHLRTFVTWHKAATYTAVCVCVTSDDILHPAFAFKVRIEAINHFMLIYFKTDMHPAYIFALAKAELLVF